jgi:hypothetical protein
MSIEVLITDEESGGFEKNAAYFSSIDQWAREYCSGYKGYNVQDVSDVSLQWDEIAAYFFEDEKSATWFKLKWLSK